MMGRQTKNIAPLAIAKLKKPGLHFVGYVSGLALHVSASGARSWILRMMIGGKRRDIGLGSFADVALAQARDAALDKRRMVRDGIDPVGVRRAAKAALKAEQDAYMTFTQATEKYIAAHQKAWKNAKHVAQWSLRSTFRDWAGETTSFAREVIEHALAHQLKDKAEAAYARGDLFTKRSLLMQAWNDFLAKPKAATADIKSLRQKTA